MLNNRICREHPMDDSNNTSLRLSGIMLFCRERLIILVMTWRMVPRHSVNSHVGIGSRPQCLDGEARSILSSSSSVVCANADIIGLYKSATVWVTLGLLMHFVIRFYLFCFCKHVHTSLWALADWYEGNCWVVYWEYVYITRLLFLFIISRLLWGHVLLEAKHEGVVNWPLTKCCLMTTDKWPNVYWPLTIRAKQILTTYNQSTPLSPSHWSPTSCHRVLGQK